MAGVGGKKKSKKNREDGAPKPAVTAFIHFSNERREIIRGKNPEVTFASLSKLISQEWNSLTAEEKKKYFDSAQRDRERFQKEMEEYQQTDAYRLSELKRQEEKKKMEGGTMSNNKPSSSGSKKDSGSLNIPIFTEDFLEHNRARDQELRVLRKSVTEVEEQNAILGKHIERMKAEVDRQQGECTEYENQVVSLKEHFSTISQYFSNLPLPGHEAATTYNIDSYMSHLRKLCLDKDHSSPNDVAIKLAKERCNKLLLEHPHLFSF